MSSKSGPQLAIFLGSTWALKNVVLTGLLPKLGAHFQLSIWVIPSLYPGTLRLAKEMGLEGIQWREIPPFKPGPGHQLACRIQKGIMYHRHQVSTEKIAQKSLRGKRSSMNRFSSQLLKTVMNTPLVHPLGRLATKLRRQTTDRSFFSEAFEQERPDLILLTNAVDRLDDPIYFEAEQLGIPQLNMVHSWDNLTSKGIIHQGLSRVLVWNQVMKDEVLAMYQDYRPEQVVEVGITRFDVYRDPLPPKFSRQAFFSSLGLDPNRRLLLYANTATRSFPSQPQVIQHIISGLQDGTLPDDLQLLIRLHPHDLPADYKGFRDPGQIALWPPPDSPGHTRSSDLVPDADDLWVLAASLRHSELCINAASTMALDAAACDIPIISVAYDGDQKLSYFDSIKSAYDYEHQKPFLQLEAVDLVESRDELLAAINQNLAHPKGRAPQRAAVGELFWGGSNSAVTRFQKAVLDAGGVS